MKKITFIFFLIILSSNFISLEPDSKNQFVVWNVGQGQWVSWISADECLHFDSGGEFFPMQKISSLCRRKKNRIFLTHWDLDHMSGIKKIKFWPQICHEKWPAGFKSLSSFKQKIISGVEICRWPLPAAFSFEEIFHPTAVDSSHNSSNGLSAVYLAKDVLISGDSTTEEEKIWSRNEAISKTKILILGHHGSKSSTSRELLQRLPRLKMAVASQRWIRYRHPHPTVIQRLKSMRIPLLLTEDWGSLHFLD